MKLRALIIVTERLSANGICAISVAKAMAERGDDVYCIVNKEYGDVERFDQNGIHYVTVRPRLVYAINSLLGRRKDLSSIVRKTLGIVSWLINKTELLFSLPTWPVISRGYSKRILRCIQKASDEKKFNLMIPVYTQIDTIIAANKYKAQYDTKVKVIPYFLDSLAAGYGPKIKSKQWVERRGLKWERKLLKDVDHIVMMKSSEPFYIKNKTNIPYFVKISFLDLPLFVPKHNRNNDKKNGLIDILYVGTIPGHIRNPKYFLEVFSQVQCDGVQLTIIGPSTCESLIKDYVDKDKRIKRIQSVPHSEAIERIDKADILLNLGNNLTTMTPSKIFEYISTGKPIISTAPIKEEPCIPYLTKYGNACIIYEDKNIDESVALITKFVSNAHNVDPVELSDIFYLNQPQAFLKVIDKTLSNS